MANPLALMPELRKAGTSFSAKCPFHADRTPSFRVYPDLDGQDVMILVTPRGAARARDITVALDGSRVLGFEFQVRKIIDELLRSDTWKGAGTDH